MYDAIIVGARCAGSPLAMLLARKGYRVLLTDRSFFPSDTISTHHVHQPGVARLKRWRLLEELRSTGCPAVALAYAISMLREYSVYENNGRSNFASIAMRG